MNRIQGVIDKIDTNGLVSRIDINCCGIIVKVLLLQTPASFKEGDHTELFVKEIEILITKQAIDTINKDFISIDNILNGNIVSIKNGEIFTEIQTETEIGKIIVITETESFNKLNLAKSSPVSLLIKANSIGLGAPE